jgi:hypothetical protein
MRAMKRLQYVLQVLLEEQVADKTQAFNRI